jgi:hypothetical protein
VQVGGRVEGAGGVQPRQVVEGAHAVERAHDGGLPAIEAGAGRAGGADGEHETDCEHDYEAAHAK